MSKGTKQIRFGRVERLISELERVRDVIKNGEEDGAPSSPYAKGRADGYAAALEMVIDALRELGL